MELNPLYFTHNTMKVLETAMKATQIPQLGWLGEDNNELVFPTHTLTLGPNESEA